MVLEKNGILPALRSIKFYVGLNLIASCPVLRGFQILIISLPFSRCYLLESVQSRFDSDIVVVPSPILSLAAARIGQTVTAERWIL